MKILLVAINSKYIHSNLAIHSLRKYTLSKNKNISSNEIVISEYTINNSHEEIIRGIYEEKADVIAISTYIWNVTTVIEVVKDIKKVLPNSDIWLGGPEVTFNPKAVLEKHQDLKGVMIGEGEEVFSNVARYYTGQDIGLESIKGIAYKETDIIKINKSETRLNMSSIPFPYENISEFENKIIYYESSRGCPFSCSYCLSSLDKGVRFRDIELVKEELKLFLDKKVAQVKFVDRTFNCNKKHAMSIWSFIKEHDNGITNFHFEISADLISDDEIKLLSTLRAGQVQFEIGVQSTNEETIKEIKRTMDFNKLSEVVEQIKEANNIHLHLDIIAGLPYEDYSSFINTFNNVYSIKPEQIQLGFLKVLKGSYMELKRDDYKLLTMNKPPYEVLSSKWLKYEEIILLKLVEDMVETYYNSGQFTYSIEFLESYFNSPFDLYLELGRYYKKNKLDIISHSRLRRYNILLEFFKGKVMDMEAYQLFEELIVFDLYLREKLKSRPSFIINQSENEMIYKEFYKDSRYTKANSHIELFDFDLINSVKERRIIRGKQKAIFDYNNRNVLDKNAHVEFVSL